MKTFIQQKTLREPAEFSGVALHTGDLVSLRILPGEPDTGYVFRRMDVPGAPFVRACADNVKDTLLATSLGENGTAVKTVEHLLSSLAGLGVDNALMEVMGDEVPIMDGSALAFVAAVQRAGLVEQGVPKKLLRILGPVEVDWGNGSASLRPSNRGFTLRFVIDFPHPAIGRQEKEFAYTPEGYLEEIAFARTFGFLKDVEALRRNGLARGGTLENAVVVGDDGVVNSGGLRAPDEFVRHKLLDSIGDLSLLGIPILGAYTGIKAGHKINHLLMKEVLAHPERWDLVLLEENRPSSEPRPVHYAAGLPGLLPAQA